MTMRTLLMFACLAVCLAGSARAKLLTVSNATFDPLADAMGAPPFDTLGEETTSSPLGLDYWIVQRDSRSTPEWQAGIEARGGHILGVMPEDSLLVSVAEQPNGGGLARA